jgi:large subunit ribosomal protein L1
VGAESIIQDIIDDKIKFDKVLSTKEMFPQVIKIAKYLGPKGLMPSPARGTVSDDIKGMMDSIMASTKFEMDGDGYIHLGKSSASIHVRCRTHNVGRCGY